MFKKLFAIFTGSKPVTETRRVVEVIPPSPPTPEEEMKKHGFLFPETLTVYKTERARLREEIPAAFQMCQKLAKEFNFWFAANKGQAADAAEMLKRRQIEKEWRNRVGQAEDKLKKLEKESSWLEINLQRKDRRRYLSEGTEIFRSKWENRRVSYNYPCQCRVVVKWQDKILLLQISQNPILTGESYGNIENMTNTGEYESPVVEWATESLDQFKDEELEAVARFQSDTANQ